MVIFFKIKIAKNIVHIISILAPNVHVTFLRMMLNIKILAACLVVTAHVSAMNRTMLRKQTYTLCV